MNIMRINWKDKSLWALLLANLVTIFFAVLENWNFATLLLIFCLQSAIIGFFNLLKMFTANVTGEVRIYAPGLAPTKQLKFARLVLGTFFFFHYGFFMFVFLASYTWFFMFAVPDTPQKISEVTLIAFSIMAFFVSHLFSYYNNFIKNKGLNMDGSELWKLFWFPYVRVIPMNLAILFGWVLFVFFGNQLLMTASLVLKTFADIVGYSMEYTRTSK